MDERRVRGVRLDRRAEPVDVHVHGPRLTGVVIAPDALEELVAAEDLTRVPDEEREELEDLRLHADLAAVLEDSVAGDVDLDSAEVHGARWRIGGELLTAPED